MMVIRFVDGSGLAKGISIFRQYGDAIPDGEPDTYIVSDKIVQLLEKRHIHFERVETTKNLPETLFTDIQKSYSQLRAGTLIRVEDPTSLDDVLNAGKNR